MQKYALLSVYNKIGIANFAKDLIELNYKIISTGGTAKVLSENNIPFISIQEITNNPESFDGRMKTISFQIESGILFDRANPKHVEEAKKLNIKPIDLVVCNLYPFEQTIAKKNATLEETIENIDVGGPTMVRAAAKNFKNVLVVIDPKDYEKVVSFCHSEQSAVQDDDLMEFRQKLATKAFAHLSFYDSQIAEYLQESRTSENIIFPQEITIPGRKLLDLRYGENPHQKGAVYIRPNSNSTFSNLIKKWGRELSLINATDINAGLESIRLFKEPCAVVIKHNSPSGIALGGNIKQALERAIEADPESAFGGIIVLNKSLDFKTAKAIGAFKDERQGNIDIVAAPKIENDALEYLKSVRKTMGIYEFGKVPENPDKWNLKWIDGGFILQTADIISIDDFKNWKIVTKKQPTEKQLYQMQLAWKFITRVRSNSVLVVDKELPMTRGIGSGQTSRIRSTKIALEQAGEHAKNGILASDSFFPFGDSVKFAAEKNIAAIVQQGGSINDQQSIDEANKAEIIMIMTNRRAFWH